MSNNPAFGVFLRALRMRYCWSKRRGYFVRVQDMPDGLWRVEVVPPVLKHLTKGDGEFRVGGNIDELIDLSPALLRIAKPAKPIVLIMNDAGEVAASV